jgi:hypothetical protein
MRDFPEADWKVFRELRQGALERFCERVLAEIGQVASEPGKSHHQRYLDVFKLMQERDEELARAFNDPRRSTAFFQIAAIYLAGLFTDEELSRFSEETQAAVELLSQAPAKYR